MRKVEKYKGIIPAFYATYDKKGKIDREKAKELAKYLIKKGVKGLYVGGSSGECIYQSTSDRMKILESVMEVAEKKITVIAHVGCNNTKDSVKLSKHAESVGVDAIASIPPIYFKLPDYAIRDYWNSMSKAAPKTDFIIYNIPQLAGVALSVPLLKEMLKNERVIGVKNSSLPSQDIEIFKAEGSKDNRPFVVFNGPDEELVSGLAMGADGGIGGTYTTMIELYLAIFNLVKENKIEKAREIQYKANEIIYTMCGAKGNLYATMKEILKRRIGLDLGGVRLPLYNYTDVDNATVEKAISLIDTAISEL